MTLINKVSKITSNNATLNKKDNFLRHPSHYIIKQIYQIFDLV